MKTLLGKLFVPKNIGRSHFIPNIKTEVLKINLMAEKHWIDDNHYREVSEDGKTSWVYKADGGLFSTDTCIEVADHRDDGTTVAHNYEYGIMNSLIYGGRGDKK